MTIRQEDQNPLRQYLLGDLISEDQRQRIEERFLTDADYFEELLLSEDELIDQYINGHLSDEDRSRFECHFLSTPERHQKLRFGRALSQYVTEKLEYTIGESVEARQLPAVAVLPTAPTWLERFRAFGSNQTWALRAAVASAVVIVITGALWLSLPRVLSPQSLATLTLTISANNRAEGVQAGKVKLPINADALSISLELPDRTASAAHYRAELMYDDGGTKPLEVARRDAQSVSVMIPSAQLARGQYALKLFTTNADGTERRVNGSYFFTVE